MELTDFEVVRISNALLAKKDGILKHELVFKLRYRLRKIVGELSKTYEEAYKAHDEILKEKYNGVIKSDEVEKYKEFNLDWTNLLKANKGEYNIDLIPIEMLMDVPMIEFQEEALKIIINDPDAKKEEAKVIELETEEVK